MIVTGGHGDDAGRPPLRRRARTSRFPVERHEVAATHGAGCTHSATLAALLARGETLEDAARGAAAAASRAVAQGLAELGARRRPRRRDRTERSGMSDRRRPHGDSGAQAARPPDHQLRRHERDRERDARARRAAGDGARARGGRGDGSASPRARAQHRHALADWVEAMLLAGRAANGPALPVVLDPVGAGATRYRTETARRLLDELDVAVLRGNAAEIATLAGRRRRSAASSRSAAGGDAGRAGPRSGPYARVRRRGHRPGRPRLGRRARAPSRTATSCSRRSPARLHVDGDHRLLPGRRPHDPLEAAAEALVAFGVAGEEAAREANGPGTSTPRSTTRSTRSTRTSSTSRRRSR